MASWCYCVNCHEINSWDQWVLKRNKKSFSNSILRGRLHLFVEIFRSLEKFIKDFELIGRKQVHQAAWKQCFLLAFSSVWNNKLWQMINCKCRKHWSFDKSNWCEKKLQLWRKKKKYPMFVDLQLREFTHVFVHEQKFFLAFRHVHTWNKRIYRFFWTSRATWLKKFEFFHVRDELCDYSFDAKCNSRVRESRIDFVNKKQGKRIRIKLYFCFLNYNIQRFMFSNDFFFFFSIDGQCQTPILKSNRIKKWLVKFILE